MVITRREVSRLYQSDVGNISGNAAFSEFIAFAAAYFG